jgi:phosphatidylinositol glycan class K
VDPAIGVYIIDRYTYYALEFLERVEPNSKKTMGEFLTVCPKRVCISTVGIRKDLYPKDPNKVPITNFFGAVRPTEILTGVVNITIPVAAEDPDSPVTEKILEGKTYSDLKIKFQEQFPTKLFK